FFFFQAEDGIRDATVTGVQTCALPIWERLALMRMLPLHLVSERRVIQEHRCLLKVRLGDPALLVRLPAGQLGLLLPVPEQQRQRSEERRVGKECGSRGSACQQQEKER